MKQLVLIAIQEKHTHWQTPSVEETPSEEEERRSRVDTHTYTKHTCRLWTQLYAMVNPNA